MTDQEINKAVARKLGYFVTARLIGDGRTMIVSSDAIARNIPDYCHSIEAAWEICEHLTHFDIEKINHNPEEWRVDQRSYSTRYVKEIARASTAPMAICLAFLKLP